MSETEESELEKVDTRETSSIINGTLSCFCDSEYEKHGYFSTTYGGYNFKSSGASHLGEKKMVGLGAQSICKSYMLSEGFKNNYALISSFIIFAINNFLIFTAEPLVGLVGINFATNERAIVSLTIFVCLVLNTCVMPMLLQANFSADYPNTFMDLTFSEGGRNSDFGANWYDDIGAQLLISLFLLSLQPIFNTFFEMIFLKTLRYIRRFYWYRTHDNNQVDNIKFLELYAGPEHQF